MIDADNPKLCMNCMSQGVEEGICTSCGSSKVVPFSPDSLVPGTTLCKRYIVGRQLSCDGEAKLYIGLDRENGEKLWIKEYMPGRLAVREKAGPIVLPKRGCEVAYKSSLADFEELCEYLSSKDRGERLLPCINVLHENNTAYGVFRYFKALTFTRYLEDSGSSLTWTQAKRLFMSLLNSVSSLGRKGIFHRGISPETILVDKDGRLWLWELSVPAARTDRSELQAKLFDGYAAPEQYSMSGWQGGWTDVYGLCAVLYKAITGNTPQAAISRLSKDELLPPDKLVGGLPANVSDAIYRGMALSTKERIQNADDLCAALLEDTGSNTAVYDGPILPPVEPVLSVGKDQTAKSVTALVFMGIALSILIGLFIILRYPSIFSSSGTGSSSQTSSDSPPASPITVPNLTGQDITLILSSSEYSLLFNVVYVEQYNDQYPKGQVFNQQPEADALMSRGGRVILYVSKGADSVQMPKIVGTSVASATRLLTSMGIRFEVLEIIDENYQVGIVGRVSHNEGVSISRSKDIVLLYTAKNIPPAAEQDPSQPASSSSAASS